ncbi:ABC-F family ATP-binding cassette domain-containing protein [Halarcobacter bivalviorum]|uniref:ABC transporter ATP-binding protein n=1 Tax=Halarcobacter bivalviorum TaxID=663364 RepID=A0AAX2A9R7_9BACT|nr:ABC-F family ATP-binding cassette domain-containing protein [Halarcobacter bivalviorum]AXH13159.1 ABC transporter, ATP-binding protein [Halarcobacter bivalviorum]RXK10229.1 ABC transporter ATP-binding protein [Halarcobacter bivalviorum]
MIELINISKSYPTNELYSELNLRLNSGDKVGLVGRNGTGKSTLFKLILGEEPADSGDINFPKGYKIGALKQYFNFSEKTLLDETALALSEEDKYNIYKAEKILFGLGFTQEDLEKDPKSFSGGYQIRINLAKLLLTEPNMLLLDEPTNYLDILSIRWLKAFLKSFKGEVILITHDRDFMDSVCTHTLGIIRKSAFMIQGGTRKFYEQLASNEEHYEKQKVAQEKKIKDLEEFIAKNKARAATATLAQSKVKILEKMDIMDDLEYDSNLKFDFNYKDTAAKFLLEVKDLSFGYTPENILFKDITFALSRGETLGIIGKNGKGKSTLLNVIAGELKQLSGSVDYHPSCVFGHFGQTNISHLNKNNTIMDEIYSVNNKLAEPVIRSICGLMMFSKDNAKKKISLLSGGEKSRVMLGKIIAQDVNLLFLDEPTNHLDIDSIEALTNAIKAFEGSCIIVTHSEELLRAVCDRLIVFTNDKADYFNGTYDEFLEKIGWDDDATTEKKPVAKPKVNKKESKRLRAAIVAQKSKETAPIKKEIVELEALIPTLKATEKSQKESQLLELQLKLEKMNAEFEKRMKEV